MAQMDAENPVVTASDADEEMEAKRTVGIDVGVQTESCPTEYFVQAPEEVEMSDDVQSVGERIDEDEAMSLEDILFSIPVDVPLPSAGLEITHIILGQTVYIPGVDEGDWYKASLPKIHPDDKGKEPFLEEAFRTLIHSARQDGRTLDDVQTLRFNEFRKGFLAHCAAVTADSMDFRKEFRALNAKVTSLDEQVAATRNDLLEFSATAQETLNHITDQLSKLIAYINRGGNDKKGEVSSSRPQPPPDDQNRGSGNTCGGNVRTTDIVDRFNGSMSREGQSRGRSGGSRSRVAIQEAKKRIARWSWNEEVQQEATVISRKLSADQKRSEKEMKRRRVEESADGLALMTSSVTSSYSADGLREQSQESAAQFKWRKRQEACKRKGHKYYSLSVLYKTHFKREEVVSNGINSNRGFIYFKSAIEECRRVSETTLVQLQYCGRNTLITQCTNRGKNEKKGEAIDFH
ncbi:histone acetyltransferase type B catalytic subunit-like [Dorcoceras hygrometricum]|uniref:Histone acetyltransferase type B catalytic subunit-like n=1 Tax=Dorcoceras hygrometricum TaxID=472368 RepID=A0A2Z7D261_9LAMI|nr:histone acetyltransferase type B catalytic subunit-like [Dorcoceras hygrometricum]